MAYQPIGMGSKRAGSYYNNFLTDAQRKKLKGFDKGVDRQRARARMLNRSGFNLKQMKRTRADVNAGKYTNYGMTPSSPAARSRPPAPGGASDEPVQQSLPEWALIDFERQRMDARNDIGRSLAQNQFQQGLLGLQRTRQIRDVTRNFRDSQMKFDPSMAARGLLRLGVRDRAHRLHGEARQRHIGDIDFNYNNAIGGLDLGRRQLEESLADALARINVDEQSARGRYLSDLQPLENPYA